MKLDISKEALRMYNLIKALDEGEGAYLRHINICSHLNHYHRKKTLDYLQQKGFISECKPKYFKIEKEWQ